MTSESGYTYTVKSGDTLSLLAQQHGLSRWRDIYDHKKNAAFRQKRPDPNLIYPGDEVWIPALPPNQAQCSSSQEYVFQVQRTVPVVLLPGIMGSRLIAPWTGFRVWDPDAPVLIMAPYIGQSASTIRLRLGLHRNLELSGKCKKRPDKNDFGWGGVAWSFYSGLLETLEKTSFGNAIVPVYACGYDWRQSNLDSGKKVAKRIAEICEKEKADQVILVTHSMGGLVARACCLDAAASKQIMGVIHTVHPSVGAPVIYRRLKTGFKPKDDGLAMTMIFGHTAESFATIAGSMQGPIDLLPSDYYRAPGAKSGEEWLTWSSKVKASSGVSAADIFAVYGDSEKDVSVFPPAWRTSFLGTVAYPLSSFIRKRYTKQMAQRLKKAKAYHTKVGTKSHPHTHVLSATGTDTDVSVHLTKEFGLLGYNLKVEHKRSKKGDGSVPLTSQVWQMSVGGGSAATSCPVCAEVNQSSVCGQNVSGIAHDEFLKNGSKQKRLVFPVIVKWMSDMIAASGSKP